MAMAYTDLHAREQRRLEHYVQNALEKGFSFDAIKEQLKRYGYTEEDVEPLRGLAQQNTARAVSLTQTIKEKGGINWGTYWRQITQTPSEEYSRKALAIVLGLALVIIIPSILLLLPEGKNCGADASCFIIAAQQCQTARFRQEIANTTFRYHSTSDCTLIKTIERIGKEEPDEVAFLFENKQMSCAYEKNKFNENWITSLTKDLDQCEGNLKTRLLELALASYSL